MEVKHARKVVVAGATGRTGRLVVEELLRSDDQFEIFALVRNETKAAETPSLQEPKVRVVTFSDDAVQQMSAEVDAAIWCSDGQDGLEVVAEALKKKQDKNDGGPRIVFCSSAAVSRPTWGQSKQQRFEGAAEIPIVRLNPGDILGKKRAVESLVRKSGVSYVILRPTGLNDNWPEGRPLLSQGDLAVGRTSRQDLASMLVAILDEPDAAGKTVEMFSVAGYPKPAEGYARALAPLLRDSERGLRGSLQRAVSRLWRGIAPADEATYGLLQQLLPGEAQDSARLAMGQTYEQLDRGEEGRLGSRGKERVPSTFGS
eukprot:CAMPEP_0115174686 /NCGR_PEP_ID=MMETSP0270-20121206/3967_1 /TAXON_ID=71861 /ORGANISM="Scrippsiella trochoidea, Strain CCMP3099" /LENGTH=314 /DNA_ID=CAMNT_0002587533 /DNA_START=191 /DNA_END=1135 /DNA_ORIENTATION=+